VHLYNFFSARRYIALTASVKFRKSSPKTARNEQVVRTKSHTGSKFSKIFFEQLYTAWIVVCTCIEVFSVCRQMAPQQSAKFRTAFFGQFRVSLTKDSIANYASIWAMFSTSVTGPDALCNALNISQIRL